MNGTPYIVAEPNLCRAYNKWGRPNPPYIFFRFDGKDWKRIPLSELPIEFRIHKENDRCKDIDPSSAYLSSGKGTKSNPVFYVTCGKAAGAFNVFFSKSDVDAGNMIRCC